MRIALRVLSFGVGMGIFLWCLSHAGGFYPDGSPVDPNPPPFYAVLGGSTVAVLLWLYALGMFQVLTAAPKYVGEGAVRPSEPSLAPEPVTGPPSKGESSPPAR